MNKISTLEVRQICKHYYQGEQKLEVLKELDSLTPVIYLSKQLDTKIQGWSACLRALTAVALLTQESKKLTFEAPTVIHSPHDFMDFLTNP